MLSGETTRTGIAPAWRIIVSRQRSRYAARGRPSTVSQYVQIVGSIEEVGILRVLVTGGVRSGASVRRLRREGASELPRCQVHGAAPLQPLHVRDRRVRLPRKAPAHVSQP